MKTIEILYPEHRNVDEATILSWASDSYYNNADSYRCSACGEDTRTEGACLHEGECTPVYADGASAPRDLAEAMEWLEDQGEVTFARSAVLGSRAGGGETVYAAGYAYACGYHN